MRPRRTLALAALATLLAARAATARPANLPDRDGDGLPDRWEQEGVVLDGATGPRFIDLPAMGADPTRPDVFLHVDWMAGAAHDQRPSPEALRMVVAAFAEAPYVSPTGSVGIALHVDAGPDSTLFPPDVTWGALSRARAVPWQKNLGTAASGTYDWGAFDAIKEAPGGFTASGRAAIFHYALFGSFHDLDDPHGWGASGNSRGIGGTDLLVTLGNFTDGVGSPREQAGTLMHELGHNLGLRHGGCDDINLKLGYASVMNYAYQMEGVTRGGMQGLVDFSRGPTPVLDESLLGVPEGPLLGARPERASVAACVAPGAVRAGRAARHAFPPVAGSTVRDADACAEGVFDDWKHVRLNLGGIGRGPRARRR